MVDEKNNEVLWNFRLGFMYFYLNTYLEYILFVYFCNRITNRIGMFNNLSFIYLFIKKRITKRGLKIIGNFLIFLFCFSVIIKWNTVPTMTDSIIFWDFDRKVKEKNYMEINIVNPYYAFSTKDSSHSRIGFKFDKEYPDSTLFYRNPLDGNWFGCLDRTKYREYLRNIDSLHYLYIIDVDKTVDVRPLRAVFINNNSKVFVDTLYKFKNGGIVCKDEIYMDRQKIGVKSLYVLYGSHTTIQNPFRYSEFKQNRTWTSYFDLHDISQMYYKLKLDQLPRRIDSITVSIDFAGATRFTGIYPSPDEISLSGIKYTNQEKIKIIKEQGGVNIFCQYLEASGIQSARVYVLSTIATFFFGLFAKQLIETKINVKSMFLFRRRKRLEISSKAKIK